MSQLNKPREAGPFWFDGGCLPVKVCYAPDKAAWKYALKSCDIKPEPFPKSSGRCTTFDKTLSKFSELVVIITFNIPDGLHVSQIIGLMAHEATHAMQFTMQSMHPDYAIERHNEVEAYFIQWVTQNIYSHYCEYQEYKNASN
jgi:hypothetical protein